MTIRGERKEYFVWWYAPGEGGRKWAVASETSAPIPLVVDRVEIAVAAATQIVAKGGKGVLAATGYLRVKEVGRERVARISDELDPSEELVASASSIESNFTLEKV